MHSDIIETANDMLMYRKFDECIDFCKDKLDSVRGCSENTSIHFLREALCTVACQAYAELDRWQEVLPFVTQLYNGIEECPPKIVQLCILLLAKMKDQATCSAVATIWIRHKNNHKLKEYASIVELYIANILIPADRWEDIPSFLESCHSVNVDWKDNVLKQVRNLQHFKEQEHIDVIETVESTDNAQDSESALSSNREHSSDKSVLSDGPFYSYVKFVCDVVRTNVSDVLLTRLRNIALFAVISYLLLTRWNDYLSWQSLFKIQSLLRKLWKSLFSPLHMMSR